MIKCVLIPMGHFIVNVRLDSVYNKMDGHAKVYNYYYKLTGRGINCCCSLDIDECFEAAVSSPPINLCENSPNSQCVNNIGSFNCTCVPGYTLDDGKCERK